MLQNRRFSPWASGCNLCIAVARSSFVFCNSVSANRSGMAASRFLAAAAACAKLLCFAAASRKL